MRLIILLTREQKRAKKLTLVLVFLRWWQRKPAYHRPSPARTRCPPTAKEGTRCGPCFPAPIRHAAPKAPKPLKLPTSSRKRTGPAMSASQRTPEPALHTLRNGLRVIATPMPNARRLGLRSAERHRVSAFLGTPHFQVHERFFAPRARCHHAALRQSVRPHDQ